MNKMNAKNIRNNRLGLWACAVSLGVLSCTSETDIESLGGSGEVVFSAKVDNPVSRVTESAWDGDERIAVKSGETVKTYTVDTEGVMSTEETPYAWEGEAYDVTAWTPYTDKEIDLTNQTTEELLFNCDLLASHAKVESKIVRFFFTHRMTRLWWELQITDENSGYTQQEIDAAKVTFLGYGAATYTDSTVTPVGEPDKEISTRIMRSEYYWEGEAMMVPCEMWEKPLIKVEIGGNTYIYTPSRNNPNDVKKRTGDLLPNTWQRYYLSVTKEGLEVDMKSESIGWEEGATEGVQDALFKAIIPAEISGLADYEAEGFGSGTFISDAAEGFSITYTENNASGGIDFEGLCDRERSVSGGKVTFTFKNIRSDIRLAYTTEYMEVGYYLYTDGTYGETYKENGTAGVVFRVGKHETDDASRYGGKLTAVHGYAVALGDETGGADGKYKWKDGAVSLLGAESPENAMDGQTSLYIGYLQTEYLLAQADASEGSMPAAEASRAKNQNNAIPDTSGWYLPSHTQLKDLAILAGETIEGCAPLDGDYWDCSFDNDGSNAYHVTFSNGADTNATFWQSSATESKVRLIITF